MSCARAVPIKALLLLALAVLLPANAVWAATYYISPSGSNRRACSAAQSASTPRQSLEEGLSCLKPGDTLVLLDGTYAGPLQDLPGGKANNWITIRAQNDGGAIIAGGLQMTPDDAYVQIAGLRLHGDDEKVILGHHLKFQRMEFKRGPASGNTVNTQIGSNDADNTADILIEDSWFHGSGGRYNVIVYNSDRVVLRRVVIRHDGGWTDDGRGDPEAGLNFYNSANCAAQNVIVIDSMLRYSTWQGAFYSVKNESTGHANSGNAWQGIIALNNQDLGMRFDASAGAISGAVIQDAVLWDNANGGISFGTGNVSATASELTIGRSKMQPYGDFRGGIGAWGGGSKTLRNLIITGVAEDLIGVTASHFLTYGNSSRSRGTGRLTDNPLTNGLTTLPLINGSSELATAGSSNAAIGATVLRRVGATGTLHGEADWNVRTAATLWPWPHEERLKREMCTEAGVTRGFCSAPSLTRYIWNYLR